MIKKNTVPLSIYSTLCVYNIHNKSYLTLIFVARSRFARIPLASQPRRPGRLLVSHLQQRVLSVVINWVSLKSISRPLPGRVVSYKIIFKCLRGRVGQRRSNILLVFMCLYCIGTTRDKNRRNIRARGCVRGYTHTSCKYYKIVSVNSRISLYYIMVGQLTMTVFGVSVRT